MKKINFELIFIFIITLLYNIFCNPISIDDVWSYGFSYNIANGLVPYVDFNMVIGPLFPIIASLFLVIFGKNMLVFNIFGAIIATILFYFMKKINNKCYYIIYAIFLFFSSPNYNILCLLLLYILLYLEKKQNNDYIIGIILGIIIFIKINIGIFLCIPSLFTKNPKRILKRILGCETIFLLGILIMLFCGNLDGFFNYTILGLLDFTNNTKFYNWGILTIFSIIVLLYFYIIKKDKSINIIYLLCFQIICYPIFDTYHVIIAFIPVLGYLLNKVNLNKRICQISFLFFLLLICIYNLYSSNINNKIFDDNSMLFKYKMIEKNISLEIKEIVSYIKNNDANKDIYIFDSMAYIYKLESNIAINKFDLISYGNMGYKGTYVYINDINDNCRNNNCLFLLNHYELSGLLNNQTNKELVKYIINNYEKVDEISYIDVYSDGG